MIVFLCAPLEAAWSEPRTHATPRVSLDILGEQQSFDILGDILGAKVYSYEKYLATHMHRDTLGDQEPMAVLFDYEMYVHFMTHSTGIDEGRATEFWEAMYQSEHVEKIMRRDKVYIVIALRRSSERKWTV